MANILDIQPSTGLFTQMMAFLTAFMQNQAPLVRKYGGFCYFFQNATIAQRFDKLIDGNPEEAIALASFSIKEGSDKVMNIILTSGYTNTILKGTTGNTIDFTFYVQEGSSVQYEPATVNYTFECNGVTQTYQDQYAAGEDVSFKIDRYLLMGKNNITIQIRGNTSKVSSTIYLTYTVTELSVSTDFSVAYAYGKGENIKLNLVVNGNADSNGYIKVKFFIDGEETPENEINIHYQDRGAQVPHKLRGISESNLHTLQIRAEAMIGGVLRYSDVLYYEFIIKGVVGRYVTIARKLPNSEIIMNRGNLVLEMEQYVVENIQWGYYSSNEGEAVTINWILLGGDEAQSVGSTDLADDTASVDGNIKELRFLPLSSGDYKLRANIKVSSTAIAQTQEYSVHIIPNTSDLRETTGASMLCRLLAIGRSNSEEAEQRQIWKYGNVTTTFEGMEWSSSKGWYNNALVLSGGAKATINVKPFNDMMSATSGCTVEVEFETFNISDMDAVLLSVGDRIIIKGNIATLRSSFGTTKEDKYPSNTRLKLAFVVHPKSSFNSQPLLMEIINNGITSRVVNYSTEDTFQDTSNIVIGGTDKAGIKIYAIRVYTTDLNNTQELNNTIVDSTNIEQLVDDNAIFTNGALDVQKIKNKIACLAVTGKGGQNVLQTIWDYTEEEKRPTIYVDAEWTNPSNTDSNWTCTDMRLRGHGQSTMRNPLKSLKLWLKNDADDARYTTRFYRNGVEDTTKDHRWQMKKGAMPCNKFVMQCYYIDSSNCKSPALLNLIDSVMRGADLLTPPQRYARDEYSEDMNEIFPFTIRQTPDSLPAVLISRNDASSEWHFDGIFIMMDDKKSDFLYGERSIYKCLGDPFCFDEGNDKDAYPVLWDNSKVTRFEFKANMHPIATGKSVDTFYSPPQAYDKDDDEVENTGEGGEGSNDKATNYDFEQALEIIYPDYDDFYKGDGTFNLTKYKKHTDKLYNFLKWTSDCYKLDNGGTLSKAEFQRTAHKHMDLDFWASYYVIAMTNGCFDSLVRNLQLTTFETKYDEEDDVEYEIWLPLWWDIDIQYGTINTGPLAYDPPVDRTTTNDYGVAFRGSDSWIWDALESWSAFIVRCSNVLDKLYKNQYTVENLLYIQNTYVNAFPATLYNENQNYKYKQMYLSDPQNKGRYLAYCLGDGKTFRRWWMKKNWDYWMARLAAGSFTQSGFTFRCDDSTAGFSVTYGDDTFFGWLIGNDMAINSNGTYSTQVYYGTKIDVPPFVVSNSQDISIFSAPYLLKIDISQFAIYLNLLNLSACVDSVTGTLLQELRVGIENVQSIQKAEENYTNRNTKKEIGITGLANLSSLKTIQMQGFTGISSVSLANCTMLSDVFMKGSAFTTITFPNAVDLYAELPSTLKSLNMTSVKFSKLEFYDPYTLEESTFPKDLTTAIFRSMGADDSVKTMVLDWLAYKAEMGELSECSLYLTNLNWEGCTYEQVMLMGRLPKESRSYTGVVKIATMLTNEEMQALIDTFNDYDKNINVFSPSSSFKIDCASGFVVSGKTSVYEGENGYINAMIFPIINGGYSFNYKITGRQVNGVDVGLGTMGTGASGTQSNDQIIFHNLTGEFETLEKTAKTSVYVVEISAVNNMTHDNVTITHTIEVKARSYPELAYIEGQTLISENGDNMYNAVFAPEYNGTLDKGEWSLEGGDENVSLLRQTNTNATLGISNFDKDKELILKYVSQFKNKLSLNASLRIMLIYGANEVILYRSDNVVIFDILSTLYYSYMNKNLEVYDRMLRKEAYEFTTFGDKLKNNPNIESFSQLGEFRNVTAIDMENDYNLGDIDAHKLDICESINLRNTLSSCTFGDYE